MIDVVFEESIDVPPRVRRTSFYSIIVRSARSVIPRWKPMDVAFIFVADGRIKRLNAEYRGINRVTDVLSFTIVASAGEKPSGEVYMAAGQTERQAKRYRVTLADEVTRLAIHGVLHLQGYDHVKAGERKVMRELEKKIRQSVKFT